ncbi:LPS export ABC transporter permease LptF [Desulfosarcina sp. OttesenSCG-928-A07]|nr:LPS export ABC transporter permease LptF [Desulfosarcina sp. OttesenSCG-928-G17]MDL2329924.1 LPS export ABC transporter permease LptF [Desulfosarcina sp. OttesenSCG-928-A07]
MIFSSSILFRYLFLEMLPPFFINVAFFSFIFLMKQILDITDMIVNYHVGIGSVCLLMIYTMPYFLQYVIPMSVMMAVLLTFLRMSGDNEIMALKAGGMHIYRMLPPVVVFAVVAMGLTGFMTLVGVPAGAEQSRNLIFKVVSNNLKLTLKERTFNNSFKDVMLYVNRIDPKSGGLNQVLIQDERTAGTRNTVVSREGRLFADPERLVCQIRLFDGMITRMNMKDRSSQSIHFSTYDILLNLTDAIAKPGVLKKSPNEMRIPELKAHLKNLAPETSDHAAALIKYYRKFSIPVACLVMAILAAPLGIQSRQAPKTIVLGLGVSFFLLYYILLSLGAAFSENGYYPPLLGMWIPNIILGIIGIVLLMRSAREKNASFAWLDHLEMRLEALIKQIRSRKP